MIISHSLSKSCLGQLGQILKALLGDDAIDLNITSPSGKVVGCTHDGWKKEEQSVVPGPDIALTGGEWDCFMGSLESSPLEA